MFHPKYTMLVHAQPAAVQTGSRTKSTLLFQAGRSPAGSARALQGTSAHLADGPSLASLFRWGQGQQLNLKHTSKG
jgi:hypothetical protein